MSKKILWSFNPIANKTPDTYACSETIPTETGENVGCYTL